MKASMHRRRSAAVDMTFRHLYGAGVRVSSTVATAQRCRLTRVTNEQELAFPAVSPGSAAKGCAGGAYLDQEVVVRRRHVLYNSHKIRRYSFSNKACLARYSLYGVARRVYD